MDPLAFDAKTRLLVIAPHPDDESLAVGGLLQHGLAAGGSVRVVFVTDGDNNPWPQRVIERRLRIRPADRARFGMLRRSEVEAALAALGVPAQDAAFMHFPDQGVTRLLLADPREIIDRLANEIERWRPTVLAGPSPLDLHPDHSACAVLLDMAVDRLPSDLPRPTHVGFIVHTRNRMVPPGGLVSLSLSPRQQAAKRRAILCHASQLKFRRKGLLAVARPTEGFIVPSQIPSPHCDGHPIRHARVAPGSVELDLALRPCPGAFGRATLLLITEEAGQPDVLGERLSVTLPGRGMPPRRFTRLLPAHDLTNGDPLQEFEYHGDGRNGRLKVPRALLARPRRLYAKIERRFGFFDEAGWRELPTAREAGIRESGFGNRE